MAFFWLINGGVILYRLQNWDDPPSSERSCNNSRETNLFHLLSKTLRRRHLFPGKNRSLKRGYWINHGEL